MRTIRIRILVQIMVVERRVKGSGVNELDIYNFSFWGAVPKLGCCTKACFTFEFPEPETVLQTFLLFHLDS